MCWGGRCVGVGVDAWYGAWLRGGRKWRRDCGGGGSSKVGATKRLLCGRVFTVGGFWSCLLVRGGFREIAVGLSLVCVAGSWL